MENTNKKPLDKAIEDYLGQEIPQQTQECTTEECKIKQDKSILERINKKIITEDGRQLLF
jgi:hypothetical protein